MVPRRKHVGLEDTVRADVCVERVHPTVIYPRVGFFFADPVIRIAMDKPSKKKDDMFDENIDLDVLPDW